MERERGVGQVYKCEVGEGGGSERVCTRVKKRWERKGSGGREVKLSNTQREREMKH